MINKKSDISAKKAYKSYLENKGFKNVKIVSSPSDIIAEMNGEIYYFEIKMTKQDENYFGAATVTEWKQAIATPERFKFVVAKINDEESSYEFIEFSPHEFIKYSTIPPFKVYFNINLKDKRLAKRSSAIQATEEILKDLITFFERIKPSNNL